MPNYEKRTYYGDMVECCCYFTGSVHGRPRSHRDKTSTERQAKLNRKNSERHFIRLLNMNFSPKSGDYFLTLTYNRSVSKEAAKKELTNFLRRLKRFRIKHGLEELRYVSTTEKQSSYHHHLVTNGGISPEDLQRLWRHGRINFSIVDNSQRFEELGRYMLKDIDETPHTKHERRWNCSQNLKQPTVEIHEIKKIPEGEPTPPKGYYLLPSWHYSVDAWGNRCCRYHCRKLPEADALQKRR